MRHSKSTSPPTTQEILKITAAPPAAKLARRPATASAAVNRTEHQSSDPAFAAKFSPTTPAVPSLSGKSFLSMTSESTVSLSTSSQCSNSPSKPTDPEQRAKEYLGITNLEAPSTDSMDPFASYRSYETFTSTHSRSTTVSSTISHNSSDTITTANHTQPSFSPSSADSAGSPLVRKRSTAAHSPKSLKTSRTRPSITTAFDRFPLPPTVRSPTSPQLSADYFKRRAIAGSIFAEDVDAFIEQSSQFGDGLSASPSSDVASVLCSSPNDISSPLISQKRDTIIKTRTPIDDYNPKELNKGNSFDANGYRFPLVRSRTSKSQKATRAVTADAKIPPFWASLNERAYFDRSASLRSQVSYVSIA